VIYDAEWEEALFLSARRGRQRIEYLGYTTGRVLVHQELAGEQRELLARVLGGAVDPGAVGPSMAETQVAEPPAPADARPQARRTIGEFELLSKLGQGGTGVVYRAWQPSLGRQVALKCIHWSGDPTVLARFSREIQAVGRLEHPNLVKVFTCGTNGDLLFYALEFLKGVSLSAVAEMLAHGSPPGSRLDLDQWNEAFVAACEERRHQERPLDQELDRLLGETSRRGSRSVLGHDKVSAGHTYVEHVVGLMRQVAEAAHALHEAGIIHRDIKPGNIMVSADGSQAVLMDLGLAQLADDLEGRLTRTRQFVGTLRYASPEQLLAVGRVDRRSDVYGLGATLWELLALRPLFGATDQTPTPELMQRIQYEEPRRLGRDRSGIPRDLDAIVQRCLEKDPKRRYATALELAGDLQRFLAGEPVTAHRIGAWERGIRWVRRRPLFSATAATILAMLLLSNGLALHRLYSLEQEIRSYKERLQDLKPLGAGAAPPGPSEPPVRDLSKPRDAGDAGWVAFGALLAGLLGAGLVSRYRRQRLRPPPPGAHSEVRPDRALSPLPEAASNPLFPPTAGHTGRGGRAVLPEPATARPILRVNEDEAFSAQTVVLHYPAPIAIAYRRFCYREEPRDRLAQLFDTFEATIKYLVYLGISDLFYCLARSGQPGAALPSHQAFDFTRWPKRAKMTLGRWVEALRQSAVELDKQPDRFIEELPKVCGPDGFLDRVVFTWITANRNAATHRRGSISLSSEKCPALIRQARPYLERLFQEIRFVRRYPLGFVTAGYPVEGNLSLTRYRVHSCMGARVATGDEVYPLETPMRFVEGLPFIVAPNDSAVHYLWPLLLQRKSDATQMATLYVFEEIDPDHQFLTHICSAAIDHEDMWPQELGAGGSTSHDWFWERLRQLPATAPLPPGTALAQDLALPLVGTLSGEILGGNRLLGPIAKGGFGTIYDAENREGKRIAVKVLETRDDMGQFRRFQKEFDQLKHAGRQHRAIVECYDRGIDVLGRREYPWYSMEFAAGGDLNARLNERRAILKGAVTWGDPVLREHVIKEFRTIAAAVAHLHDLNIIHRDIKPANVLIVEGAEGGELRLSDFGLVKELERLQTGQSVGPGSTRGAILGTRDYMAPEQERGEGVEKTADVYSLGIVLAELAIGHRPKPDPFVAAGSPVEHDARLTLLPERLRRLIVDCTDMDPFRRPRDAHAVLHEFELLAVSLQVPQRQ
jgi:serine/threonine protein kinase